MNILSLPDSNGQETSLSTLWEDQPVAFFFMRHLG